MLKVCLDCATRYLPGVPKCPQCGGMNWRPDYEEEDMPKVTVEGGASNAAETPPPVAEAAAPEAAVAAPKPRPPAKPKAAAQAPKPKGS